MLKVLEEAYQPASKNPEQAELEFQLELLTDQAMVRVVVDPCSLEYEAKFQVADHGTVTFGKPKNQCKGDMSRDDLEVAFSLLKWSEGSNSLNAAACLNLGCAYMWLFNDANEAERVWKQGKDAANNDEEAIRKKLENNLKKIKILKEPDFFLIADTRLLEATRQLTNDPGPRIHLISVE